MTISHDANSQAGVSVITGSGNWTHTPTGTPAGVFVAVVQQASTTAPTSVTYGGNTMTAGPHVAHANGAVSLFYLISGVPSGQQTVQVNFSGSNTWIGWADTVTAAGGLAYDSQNSAQATGTNPSLTVTFSGSLSVPWFEYYGIYSGIAKPTDLAIASGTEINAFDYAQNIAKVARNSGASGASSTISWTGVSDDYAHAGVVIKESTDQNLSRSDLSPQAGSNVDAGETIVADLGTWDDATSAAVDSDGVVDLERTDSESVPTAVDSDGVVEQAYSDNDALTAAVDDETLDTGESTPVSDDDLSPSSVEAFDPGTGLLVELKRVSEIITIS